MRPEGQTGSALSLAERPKIKTTREWVPVTEVNIDVMMPRVDGLTVCRFAQIVDSLMNVEMSA